MAVPAIYAGALAVAPHGKESRTIGVALGGWTFSLIAGVGLATLLTAAVNWRFVYVVIAGTSGATLAGMLTLTGRGRPAPSSPPDKLPPYKALGIPELRPLLIACAAAMAAFYGLYSYLGDYLHHGLGQPLIVNGLATVFYGTGFGAATWLDGTVDRLGARRVAATAFGSGAVMYLAIAVFGHALPAVLALMGLLGVVNHLQVNVLVTRMTAARPQIKGAILGLNTAVTYVGACFGTAAFAPIYSTFGFGIAAAISAGLMLIASVFATRR